MNSSNTPDPMDEKWTAYIDGRLDAGEEAAFEREHPEAAAEKAATAKIRHALRRHSRPPALRNGEFFNQRILTQVAPERQPSRKSRERAPLWSLWRTAIAGTCCLGAFAAIYFGAVRDGDPRDRYLAEVVSVKAGDDELDAAVLDAEGLAVVWIDGLDRLGDDYDFQ